MANNMLIHDSADKTPPPVPGRHPLTPISGADFEPRRGVRLPAQAWLIISVAALAPVALLLWGAYGAISALLLDLPWLGSLIGALLLVAIVLTTLGLITTLSARAWLGVQQARIVRTRHGVPVDVVQQMRLDPAALEAQQIALEIARAPYTLHPNLSTQSVSGGSARADAPAQLETLPDVSPVAASTWLPWLESVPHVMLAAETGGGKTTTALHILQPRVSRGESFYIIDPNASGWGGLPSVGGGEQWPEVAAAMRAVIDLYSARQRTRREYLERTGQELPIDSFERMTVVLDEAFMARAALDSGKDSIWRRFVPILGSGARKVAISMIVLTQTANVDDLGFSGALRENFLRIALDSGAARKLIIKEEADRRRREALLAALSGLEWPAVTERQGQLYLLDRSGMERMPDLRTAAQNAWQPQLTLEGGNDEQQLRLLRALKASGISRDMAREYGLQFANDLWSQA